MEADPVVFSWVLGEVVFLIFLFFPIFLFSPISTVVMAKKTVINFALEKGVTLIDAKLMDEVREKVGM